MNIEKAAKISKKIREELCQNHPDLINQYPHDKYVSLMDTYPVVGPYNHISGKVKSLCEKVEKYFGDSGLALYHKFILSHLIASNLGKLSGKKFPNEVISLFMQNFERILEEIDTIDYNGPYSYSNDKFQKDMAVCSLKLIPVGARKIHLSKLSKRFFLKKGLHQFVRGLGLVAFELKGFKPLFQMHTDSKDPYLLKEFNEAGFKRSYFRIADLLKKDDKIKGLFGNSWFYDPKIEEISPRLSFLRKIPLKNGGRLFYIGSNEQAVKDATLKSKTRKRLYKEGKYLPTNYLIVWSREKLISWAESNR